MTLVSLRFGLPVTSEHEDLAEAVDHAYWQVENNRAAPFRIFDGSSLDGGRVLLEGAALDAAIQARGDEIEQAWGEMG